jgi:hypothetical protein
LCKTGHSERCGKALEVADFARVIVVELGRFWQDKNLSLFHNLVVVST